MEDYTQEEIKEILKHTFGMKQGIPKWTYYALVDISGVGRVECDLEEYSFYLWSGLGEAWDYAMEIRYDSYRTLERRLRCFYEMLEID